MAIGGKKVFLLFLPVPFLVLVALMWRYRLRRNNWPLPPASTSSKSDDVTEELPISSQFVGFVIGRQGSKVKELEKQTSTRIRFREAKDGKVAMVTGLKENVDKAKEAILMMLKERREKKQVKSVDVVVPTFAIGRLIGKQGQNISAMQKESGARIVVDNNRGSGVTRMCTISGSTEQVSRAVAMVQQSISESEAAQQRNKLNRKLKSDNINMKTTQICSQHKSGVKESTSQQSISLKPCVLPSKGDFFPAFVSSVSAAGDVWIQPVNDKATVVDNLTNEMMDTYCNMDVTDCSNYSVGSYCAAKFSTDGQWYRAQVISASATTAHLLFIDYGDEEWHPLDELKLLLPQFCSIPIQACKCQIGGVAVPNGGWDKEAIELIGDVTMCARWEPVMVKVTDHTSHPPRVTIVNTSSNKDIDVATKLNELTSQLPQQQELVDEIIMMEMSPTQLESSVNMFDDMEQLMDQIGNQDDQKAYQEVNVATNQDDQEVNVTTNQDDHIVETVAMEMSPQLESSINTFDEALQQLDDQNTDQDDQQNKSLIFTIQQSDQDDVIPDQTYEVQGVSVTFDSDSDDDDQVTIQVEDGVITNESWLHSDTQYYPTEAVSVTVATTEHNTTHVANCVSVNPIM